MRILVKAAALLLVAGSTLAAPTAKTPRSDEAVEMSVNSWGRLINSWTIRLDGSGEVRTGKQGPGGFSDVTVEVRRLGPDPARYAKVRAMLRASEAWAGRELPCGSRITDLPYGDVHWRSGATDRSLHFDSGCQGARARTVVDQLSAVDRAVVGWVDGVAATPEPAR
jgi:hypothetical protein